MKNLKLLLVEDDKMLCAIFEMFILEMGHELIGIYQNAETAIEKCEETLPDIAILDIHIGGSIDGIEAAKIIQKKYQIPIIFLSGDIEEETLDEADKIFCKVFLAKPIYRSTLNIAISIALLNNCFLEAIQNNLEELDALIQNLNEPALILNGNKVVKVNQKAIDFLKFSNPNEIIDRDIYQFISSESTSKFKEVYAKLSQHRLLLEYFKIKLVNSESEEIKRGITFSFIQNIKQDFAIVNIDKS